MWTIKFTSAIGLMCEQMNIIWVEKYLISGQCNQCLCERKNDRFNFQRFHYKLSPILHISLGGRSEQWNYVIYHWISRHQVHASHSKYMSVSLFTISRFIYILMYIMLDFREPLINNEGFILIVMYKFKLFDGSDDDDMT